MPERVLRSVPGPRVLRAASLALAVAFLVAADDGSLSWAATTGAGQDLQVIDGDTLQSGSDIVQLYGIDAPELGQLCWREDQPWPCGVEAAFALQKLVQLSGSAVICEAWTDGTQEAGPTGENIRVCVLGPDQDLAMAMLRNGSSVALPGSFPYYGLVERQAKETGLGIWGSEFTAPSEWRAGERTRGAGKPQEDCNVKGVVDDAGERIYLVPTDSDYDDLSVDLAAGGQLFCSDEEAREAGWRRPGETEAGTVR